MPVRTVNAHTWAVKARRTEKEFQWRAEKAERFRQLAEKARVKAEEAAAKERQAMAERAERGEKARVKAEKAAANNK